MVAAGIVLDTSAYSAYKRGWPDVLGVVQNAAWIGMSVIVLGELQSGFEVGTRSARNHTELRQFLSSNRVRVLGIDEATAETYAAIYGRLRTKGRPIPTNDLWIAASALQHDCSLCSYDSHFKNVEGLVVGTNLSELGLE